MRKIAKGEKVSNAIFYFLEVTRMILNIWQERAWQKEQGKPVGPTLLYFGCRNKAADYIYQAC